MEGKMANRSILPVFWALLGVFVLVIISFNVMNSPIRTLLNDLYPEDIVAVAVSTFFQFSGLLFFALGLTLLILTARAKLDKLFKGFLLLTSSSAVGFFVSILLHGVVYGLFMLLFGEGFWDKAGIGDEPFFFIMAILVCPAAYLVGTLGSIVLIVRRKRLETQTT
jgi:polyferredoxin